METERSRILIFGGTGYIGKYMVEASIKSGHPTFVYSRPLVGPPTSSSKVDMLNDFQAMGVTIVHGNLDEMDKIVEVLRKVDIVISALAFPQILDQLKILDAIKIAGNIKRFVPSEFGCEEDRIVPLPPFEALLDKKRKVRREVEAASVPYTFVSSNCCGAYFVNVLLHPHDQHMNHVLVYGSGEAKAVLNYEEDIATYTIKTANDPTAQNRLIIYAPPKNVVSQLDLISLWEKKTGWNVERVHVPEQEIESLCQVLQPPENIKMAILHSIFVKGDLMSFEVGKDDLEASILYPEVDYTTVDQLLDLFLVNPPQPATAVFI